jgi:protocatechuate 3,4-dioxygenase, beta subunit
VQYSCALLIRIVCALRFTITNLNSVVTYRRQPAETHPPLLYPPYRGSVLRAPTQPLVAVPQTCTETTGPRFAAQDLPAMVSDLSRVGSHAALGQRIIVSGRVLDENGRPMSRTLVEIWQANAAGRYRHRQDQHQAPLDPNFVGAGQVLTDDAGRYQFVTIKPGAYPWSNHANAWRPSHIHFSLFGPAFATRLITQMYFPGDPLLAEDPIFNSTADPAVRSRLISAFDWATTLPDDALGYRFDIVLRGADATPMER